MFPQKIPISLHQTVTDARDAVFRATELLRQAGCVTEKYFEKICANWDAHGPYFVLVPGFAMPHAEPGEEVLKTGLSLLTLAEPVTFGHEENDPVDVLICLAARTREEMNEEMLVGVMELLENEANLDALRAARKPEDLEKLMNNE